MPKIVVGIIAAAFALVIGFACGALLTKPDNLVMEKIVNEKEILQEEITDSEIQIQILQKDIAKHKNNADRLQIELLDALRQKTETKESYF